MTATNHAVTGVAVVVAIHQPVLALPLAFIAHFAQDAVPHFSVGPKASSKIARNVAIADVLLAILTLGVLLYILRSRISLWLVAAAAFLCFSPDLVWGWRYYKFRNYQKVVYGPMNKLTRWHQKIQWSESFEGIMVEAVWFGLLLGYILTHR